MDKVVYWASIEYLYNEGSDDYGKGKGGYVFVFTNAVDAIDALNKIKHKLKKIYLEPIVIEFIKPYEEETEWETKEVTKHYFQLYEKAKNTNKVIFDLFYAFEND